MDLMNQQFQQLLQDTQFYLKQSEEAQGWLYFGKIAMTPTHIVDFAVKIHTSDDRTDGQIVFQNIGQCIDSTQKTEWAEWIQQWNLAHSVYYYMCMEDDGSIFLRHITALTDSVTAFYNVLLAGGAVANQAIEAMHQRFGQSPTHQ